MNNKYQYFASLQESTGEILYSRATHDCRSTTNGDAYIDGGNDYYRAGWTKERPKQVIIELSVSPARLYNDWNTGEDKYGFAHTYTKNGLVIGAPEFIRIVPAEEYEDRKSFAFKKKYAQWGTLGKDGRGPRRQVMLSECETDHLKSILETQSHISPELSLIIQDILKDRIAQ